MRKRFLKPGLYANEALAELGPAGQLLFAGLTLLADREGRLEDRPKRIKGQLFPYYDLDVDDLLTSLASITEEDGQPAFICRYVAEGRRYIQVWNFTVHQAPHVNEQASVIPPPPGYPLGPSGPSPREDDSSTLEVPEHHQGSSMDALGPGPELDLERTAPNGAGAARPGSALALPSRSVAKRRRVPAMDCLASPPSSHPAVQVYRQIFHRHPDEVQREAIIEEVGETPAALDAWEATCKYWRLHSHNAGNIAGLVDRFHKQDPSSGRQRDQPQTSPDVPDNIRHIRAWEARRAAGGS